MSTKILHVIASNFISGPEKQVLHHARDMANSPYSVAIASFRDLPETPAIVATARTRGIKAYELRGGIRPGAFLDLVRLLRQQHISVLCTHGYKANILGYFAGLLAGTPQIAFVRGWTAETCRVALYERLDRAILRRARWVVCVSPKQAEQLAPARKKKPAPIVVTNAILPMIAHRSQTQLTRAQAGIPEDAFVFGCAGRLSVEKGHRYLLDAFCKVSASSQQSVFLVILGDGREGDALRKQAAAAIADKVLFPGFRQDCDQWMRLFDCLVQPSLTEGTPNTILEALPARVPIVATAVGGVPALLHDGLTGLLVPPRDSAALAAAMLRVLQDSGLRARLARAMESVAPQYLPETQRGRLLQLYEQVLAAHPTAKQVREAIRGT